MKKTPPTLTVEQIVSVQPMKAPTKLKFERRELTQEMAESTERALKAMTAVSDFFRVKEMRGELGRWADETYEIDCPNCDGTLTFGGNSYNGHVHAKCSTPDCCSWME
jgi:hypothetical protein